MKTTELKSRAIKILGNDRSLLPEENKRLICRDIKQLLEEYFQLNSCVNVELLQEDNGYKLNINADIIRVKTFQIVK